MIDWVDVVRRLLHLYCVKTQQELSMAMGMQVDVGTDGAIDHKGIPWQILEKAVSEQCVSWDWLMTGKGDGPAVDGDSPGPAQKEQPQPPTGKSRTEAESIRLPHFETRELVRELIEEPEEENNLRPPRMHGARTSPPPQSQPPVQQAEQPSVPPPAREGTENVVRNLRELRRSMQKELRKLDQALADAEKSGEQEESEGQQPTYA